LTAISVVVLSHNRLEDLKKNLQEILAGGDAGTLELIVVDNASETPVLEYLHEIERAHSRVKILFNPENAGVAAGRNAGFRIATGEYIVALDDDARMHVDDLLKVPLLFQQNPKAGILAFRVRHAVTGEEENFYGETRAPVANFHGAAHAIKRDVFERLGYLDERCSFGGEELDFSIRCHAAGFLTMYLPDVSALHNSLRRQGATSADRRRAWIYNYVRVLFKHFPRRIAYLFAFRRVVMLLISGYYAHGSRFMLELLKMSWRGRVVGIKEYHRVPDATIEFYQNPALRPEYGNVPVRPVRRVIAKMYRSCRSRLLMRSHSVHQKEVQLR
jgi:GT2 family glycosyltransferase